jgi:hypothetical protein
VAVAVAVVVAEAVEAVVAEAVEKDKAHRSSLPALPPHQDQHRKMDQML